MLARLAPELLAVILKVNCEYHELFQAVSSMLEVKGLAFLEGRVVTFLGKILSVINATRELPNAGNLNSYMVNPIRFSAKSMSARSSSGWECFCLPPKRTSSSISMCSRLWCRHLAIALSRCSSQPRGHFGPGREKKWSLPRKMG